METAQKKEIDPLFSSNAKTRAELIAIGRKVNALISVPDPPPMTREELNAAVLELRAAQRADGISPEDNGATRELLRMRYGDDYNQDFVITVLYRIYGAGNQRSLLDGFRY